MQRIIGIVGLAHCGSTALSRLAACLPEVASAGEIHWLIDATGKNREKKLCTVCRSRCPVFSKNFLKKKFPVKRLYSAVANQFGKEILFSSDKSTRNYDRFVPVNTLEAIILYKRPVSQAFSLRRVMSLRDGVTAWRNFHLKALGWAEMYAKSTTIISLEAFMAHPQRNLRILADRLSLETPKNIPNLKNIPYHHINGNHRAHSSKKIFVDQKWRKRVPENFIKKVQRERPVRSLLNYLDAESRRILCP